MRSRDSITNYYAQPIARRDDGAVLTDDTVECLDAESAIRCAERLARSLGYVGAWAFSWTDHDGWR
jgi:hypothetical protein